MKFLKTLEVKTCQPVFRLAMSFLLLFLFGHTANAQQALPGGTIAPPELMAKSNGISPQPSIIVNFPAEKTAPENDLAEPKKTAPEKSKAERLRQLIKNNEAILANPKSSPEAKQKAVRELKLQRLKWENLKF